jgi:hypothetical protein
MGSELNRSSRREDSSQTQILTPSKIYHTHRFYRRLASHTTIYNLALAFPVSRNRCSGQVLEDTEYQRQLQQRAPGSEPFDDSM